MEDKAYIIIDDESQIERMENRIDKIIRGDGYNIKSFYINPNDRDFWNDNQEIDVAKILEAIKQKTKSHHINVIACDYNYSGSTFNGMHMIFELRKNNFGCPIILYSGKEAEVARSILSVKLDTDDKKIEYLEMLLSCKVDRFLPRDTYYDSVVEYLKRKYNFKDIVIKKMEEYPEAIIKYDSGYYDGKPFSEIIKEIKKDTLHGNRFVADILELAIAQFAKLNE